MSLRSRNLSLSLYACAICRSSHNLRKTSEKPTFPNCAFCSNRWTSHFSRPSAAERHKAIRACISAVCKKAVRLPAAGEYCIRSKQVANCERERLTEVMVAFCVDGSTKDISRTKASSDPPNNCKLHM